MGHIHLGTLPRTRLWNDVVSLLEDQAALEEVAAASAYAAEASLRRAADDPVFVEAVRLLICIPIAARQSDFGDALRTLDLDVGSSPSLMDVVAAATVRLDRAAVGSAINSDFGELATRALSATYIDLIGSDLPGLFGPNTEDVRLSFKKFSHSNGMAALCRGFFGSLVGASLSYWLDRILAKNVGVDSHFASIGQKSEFDRALRLHTVEATRIIQEFSGGWVGKKVHDKGTINTNDARDFAHVCLKKVVEELQARRGFHA